jgi:hypothetical protein
MHIQRTKVVIWLYDNIEMRIEGRIIVRARFLVPNIVSVEARLSGKANRIFV